MITQGFENIPCVNEEKSKSFPVFCVEAADGTRDADCGFVAPEGITPLPEAFCPML